ncbi:MAG: pantoate--beta-alanine ligase [Pacificimonas sp.]
MRIVRTVTSLREAVDRWRAAGESSALIPTMGALHDGHLALVARGRAEADRTVTSIFVNPTQFGPGEDLDRYPRQESADAEALEGAGCDLLYAPDAAEMYPDGFATTVGVDGLTDMLCGASRAGHFDGVATVVAKLLNQARTNVAIFGEKDWQQLAVIRRMSRDLDIATRIVGAPIVREANGLAMSSRNRYLSADDRAAAGTLPSALNSAAGAIARGSDVTAALGDARQRLIAAGFDVDYLELRGANDLALLTDIDRPARLFAAARIGGTRLIDNVAVPT